LKLHKLGSGKSGIVIHKLDSMEKSVASVIGSTALIQLLIHFRSLFNWPNFIRELNSSVETEQNVTTATKFTVS